MKNLLLSVSILGCVFGLRGQISSTQLVEAQVHQELQDPVSITLKPGFWAKPGSVFHAHIGYAAFNRDCPIITTTDFSITYVDPNTYSPDAINENFKLLLDYDTAGNTKRIYFANARADSSNSNYTLETIESLIYVYPNPTRGSITVSWDDSVDHLIHAAVLLMPNGVQLPLQMGQANGKRQASLTFSGGTGIYFLRVRLSDNRIVSKTIIKN